jgi:hypothetical protein
MALTGREKFITNALLIAVGALIFDTVVLSFYQDKRKEMADERDAKTQRLADEQGTIQKEKQLRKLVAGMNATMKADASTVEANFLHMAHDWEQASGASNATFERMSADEEHEYTRLTFQISAAGPMPAVAALIYKTETAPIPLRIESTQIRPQNTGGDQVVVYLNVSTLCRGNANKLPPAPAAENASVAKAAE